MSDVKNNLKPGQVQFIASYPPPLDSGQYKLTVAQSLRATKGGTPVPTGAIEEAVAHFRVSGPQLSLPSDLIHAAYPSPGAQGGFAGTLAHLALTRRTLPWERTLTGKASTAGHDEAPWMALLVFHSEEIASKVVFRRQLPAVEVIKPQQPSVDGAALIDLEPGEANGTCSVIDVDSTLFHAIVPSEKELRLLAHVRHAHASGRSDRPDDDNGWFPIVVANRFPGEGRKPGLPGLAGGTRRASHQDRRRVGSTCRAV